MAAPLIVQLCLKKRHWCCTL